MNFKEYQNEAIKTLKHIEGLTNQYSKDLELARLTLGLAGESGEVAEKVKKYLRDTDMSGKAREELATILRKELGDVLWYIATVAHSLNISLDYIGRENIRKLASRKKRDRIKGSGDDR